MGPTPLYCSRISDPYILQLSFKTAVTRWRGGVDKGHRLGVYATDRQLLLETVRMHLRLGRDLCPYYFPHRP